MENDNSVLEFDITQVPEPEDISDVIYNLMVNPNLSPLNYFNDFNEFVPDPRSMGNDDVDECAMFDLGNGTNVLSMTTHAMHHHLEIDPQVATEILVSKATRKMVCMGATPVAITAMLYHINFGDPNGYVIASGAKKGLENAAVAFNLKISDKKIRFDYFGDHGAQNPTIIVSVLGVFPSKSVAETKPMTTSFKKKGDDIFLIGKSVDDICSSDYLEFYHGITESPLQTFSLETEVKINNCVKKLIEKGFVCSAGPVAKGGIFFSLMRAGWVNELGFDITTDAEVRRDSFLFGEAMGRIIVGVSPDMENDFVDFMYESKIPFCTLGHVTKGELRIDDESFGYIDKMSTNL